MECFVIDGKNILQGSVTIKGAKNSVLPIMAASVLNSSGEKIELTNIPDIIDMHVMKKILEYLGLDVHYAKNTLSINAKNRPSHTISDDLMSEMRSSIFLMGPLLARLGKVRVTYPGGCSIGPRPIDLHFKGLEALGARITEENGSIFAHAPYLKGAEIHLDFPSVGATENLMMAAVLARGKTILHNVAKEPEIVDLQNFLSGMGAVVRGAGTDTIRITGVEALGCCSHRIIPDRIAAGTFLIAAAVTGGEVLIKGVIPSHLDAVVAKMREAGASIDIFDDKMVIRKSKLRGVERVCTLPYPGFPTDLQAPMMVMLALARGNSTIVESIFEARFRHAFELRQMNAHIDIDGRKAYLQGVKEFRGAEVTATDLRAGAALVIAGLAAEGKTIVRDIRHIDRGYERLEQDFQRMGARITRVRDFSKVEAAGC
ncbi:MAG: UDP-N-acetylglucosamine 1-carboxyvinyltransferase [Dethiobacteria bacterium]|jgi:UDP-N-acetylglucosamine 1-carboxyvinyltransferase